jgi:hypothetical protein
MHTCDHDKEAEDTLMCCETRHDKSISFPVDIFVADDVEARIHPIVSRYGDVMYLVGKVLT